MASLLYSSVLSYTATLTTGAAAAGYEVANIGTRYVEQPFRSTDNTQQVIELDFGADVAIGGLVLTETTFTSATIDKKPDGGAYSSVGTLALATDPLGRIRGVIAVDATVRYIRITIALDAGVSYHSIGAAWVFGLKETLARSARYGFEQEIVRPREMRDFANGRKIAIPVGPAKNIISADFQELDGEDSALVERRAASGIVALQIGVETWDVWPLEYVEDRYRYTWASSGLKELAGFVFHEVV